ncbi:protein ZGRF1-like isoform X1 [Heterocephalus glaber]|uniref:Protein ZGRF1-like isoform X1 n=1 Tax=Heterocephalus glaber TaxID=10181 RepID=A0AAX6QKW7_HETGA|nr:protein ZGRF1-like isoform X1 [Heterocephalus glaber]
MESQEFIVLYTHQKTKKAKVWQDGTLKLCPSGNKAVLHDDRGACLENLFLKCLEVKPGADLESDRYLITVEEVKATGSPAVQQEVIKEAPGWGSRGLVSSSWSRGCQPPGLKRKSTGFRGLRQVPKKMVVTEDEESSASFEAGTVVPPFYSSVPLFPAVGRKEINNMQTDPEGTVAVRAGESWGRFPTSSFEGRPAVPGQEEGLCTPLGSGCQRADPVLATEPMGGHGSAPPRPQVSQQHIRSKAQILALLKSTPAAVHENREAEPPGHFWQTWTPPAGGASLEGHAEVTGTEGPGCQEQLENTMGGRSRWAKYLSPLSSWAAASASGGDDVERQLAVQENDVNLNLEGLLVQKIQAFGTCAEKGKKHLEDEPVDNNECWNQEEKLEIPSFCGSSSLLVSCSSVGKGALLSEAGICKNNKAPFSGNDQGCTGEAVRGVSTWGLPGQDWRLGMWPLPASRHLQVESALSHDTVDKVSESPTASESLGSVQESGGSRTQPLWEVTFNLSNFETSDMEEDTQESSSISQDAGVWVREIPGNGNACIQKPFEGPRCQEISSENLPRLTSVGDKWIEKCPVKESLSKFCDKTCVGMDTGPCEGGSTGEAVAEDCSDAVSGSNLSTVGSDDGDVDSKEDANRSTQNIGSHYDFASLSSKSKGTDAELHTPDFLNIVTNQTPQNSDLLSHIQTPPFTLGSDLDRDAKQVFLPVSDNENSIRRLDSQDHWESVALAKSNSRVCNSLPTHRETKQPLYRDTEAYIPECEDLGRGPSLSHDHDHIETARNSSQFWTNPRNSSGLSRIVNNISLLKSLSEPSTALESLEMLKKGNTTFPQRRALQAEEAESRTEARKPFIRIPFTPHVNQDLQQILKENEVEPTKPLQTPLPVEFLGHQVTGSASSGVMIRSPSSRPQCSLFPDSTECEDLLANGCFLRPELASVRGQTHLSQVASPEERISTLRPLDSRHEDFTVEVSEESLRARTLPGDRFPGWGVVVRALL